VLDGVMLLHRRQLLSTALAAGVWPIKVLAVTKDPREKSRLTFDRDHGAHLNFKTEWWYLTGFSADQSGTPQFGFQFTFFRSLVPQTQSMQSTIAARHLLFAHAAVTDVQNKKMWHDQRIARWNGEASTVALGQDLGSADTTTTKVVLRDWFLLRRDGQIHASIKATSFALEMSFKPKQPLLLQGDRGLSRKGPDASQTSFYYSEPQLAASGTIYLAGKSYPVRPASIAWLDHEWSQSILAPDAAGWDWIGINLLDGSALTAFQIRSSNGAALWDGGSFRSKDHQFDFARGEVTFAAQRTWRSPSSNATYPVQWLVRTPAGQYLVKAMVDNQELDSRLSTGIIYWEGLCELWDSNNRVVGRGYLEMTGYANRLTIPT
jgi:predicted secreted hydrolase